MSGLDAQPHKILRIILNEDTWGGLAGERLERNRIEVALRSGQSVPLDALVKYPDLIIHHGVDL